MDVIKRIEDKALKLRHKEFRDDKDIQTLVEKNMGEFFDGLEFVNTELNFQGYIFDTVAYDNRQNCLAIIAYKKNDPHGSVLTQCKAYLQTIDNQRHDFAEECGFLDKYTNLSWSNSYVIIVISNLSRQLVDACAGEQRIRLYHIDLYGDGIVTLDSKNSGMLPGSSTMPRTQISDTQSGQDGDLPGNEIHEKIKKYILDQEGMEYGETKHYNKFSCYVNSRTKIFFTTKLWQTQVNLYYNIRVSGEILTPNRFVRDVSKVGKLGCGDYMSIIKSDADIERASHYIDIVYKALRSRMP